MVEVVVLIGLQASGKSAFCRERLAATHVLVSKDRMKNVRNKAGRQAREISEALEAGRSVVVDNTNVTRDGRAQILGVARAHGARATGYVFESHPEACLARNAARQGGARVPVVGIFAAWKRYQMPRLAEGFDELWYVRMVEGGFEVIPWEE